MRFSDDPIEQFKRATAELWEEIVSLCMFLVEIAAGCWIAHHWKTWIGFCFVLAWEVVADVIRHKRYRSDGNLMKRMGVKWS